MNRLVCLLVEQNYKKNNSLQTKVTFFTGKKDVDSFAQQTI
jgi:hypothetical protein